MKENILDVLMYLFEYYLDAEARTEPSQENLKRELNAAGFPDRDIERALDWLESLSAQQEQIHSDRPRTTPLRIYTPREVERLDVECRGFILFLEQSGVLDLYTREIVIDRCMALDDEEIGLEQLKWVVLMVLFNQPGQESAYTWMEELVYNEMPAAFH